MTKREKIENDAYMIIQDLAFVFIKTDTTPMIIAINLKNPNQKASFRVRGTALLFCESNLSRANTYKAQLIVERNKERLIDGLNEWLNMQNINRV